MRSHPWAMLPADEMHHSALVMLDMSSTPTICSGAVHVVSVAAMWVLVTLAGCNGR